MNNISSSKSPRRNGGGNGNGKINVVSSGVSGPPSPSLEENINNANNNGNGNGNGSLVRPAFKKVAVRYRECLKNHAAAIGGNATDGCGEFMPNGEEGTLEALKCSACNCHRNFHRKEIECDCPFPFDCYHNSAALINNGRKLILGPSQNYIMATPAAAVTAAPPLMTSFKAGSSIPSETDEKDDNGGGGRVGAKGSGGKVRKRFRTKFSQEQKEKMLKFAEKAGWRIQKLDESVVQQFCQEIGIKRRVLKVWMHNNKQSLANKLEDINNVPAG